MQTNTEAQTPPTRSLLSVMLRGESGSGPSRRDAERLARASRSTLFTPRGLPQGSLPRGMSMRSLDS